MPNNWLAERMDELIRAVDEIFVGKIPSEDELYGIHQVLVERRDAELARQSVTDEAVKDAISWLESDKNDRQREWERAGAEWRMEPGTQEMHDEQMASFDLAITALQAYEPWVSVKDRLPKSGKEILMNVTYNNRNQSKYDKVTKGFYVERFSIKEETWSDYTGNEDYCEDDDTYYIRQGWYSVCNFVDGFSYIDVPSGFTVTHWKALPEPPKARDDGC